MTRKTTKVSRSLAAAALLASAATLTSTNASADIVHLDDVIIDGSACVGFDCVNGESFGFDTIRLKENNLRIKFDDTSATGDFPSNDWQITANDSSSGGANKFSIDDISGGRTPFTIEASAPSHSLFVEDGGRIGFGTSTPVTDLHVKSGNTPTLRLEQDGSSGFAAQTWDVAGNETNFFIRDATNGSTLPLRIRPSAPTSSIEISGSGNVGLGTTSPAEKLHVTNGNFKVEQSGVDIAAKLVFKTAASEWEIKQNGATGRLTFSNNNDPSSGAPLKFDPQAVNNLLRVGVAGASTVDINGDLVITGQCSEADGACADYVFEPDYELRSIDELEQFVLENGHLPNVPSAEDMQTNGVNMAHISGRLLEKVEELTLYTVQQQRLIESLNGRIAELEGSMR